MGDYQHTPLMIRKPVASVPRDLWVWGMKNIGRPRQFPEQELRMRLFPSAKAMIFNDGLWLESLCYHSDDASFRETMFRAGDGGVPVQASYDPDDTSSIIMRPTKKGHKPITLRLAKTSEQYDRQTFAEVHQHLGNLGTVNNAKRRIQREARRDHKLHSQDIKENSEKSINEIFGSKEERNSIVKYIDKKDQRDREAKTAIDEQRMPTIGPIKQTAIKPKPKTPNVLKRFS